MKLGELLVRAGKITSEELEETLKGQAIFGGRFGTNLVEMGFLDENELTRFLSEKTGVPFATSEQLMNIPPQVIRLLPEEAVRKYRVIPLALNNRKLSLAMTDPSDFATIDEISFTTGYIVVPLITPELRLICALEKYYNIRRELRYIPVAGGGRNRGRMSQVPAPTATSPSVQQVAASAPAPSEPDGGEILELPELDDLDCFGLMEELQTQALVPASLAPAPLADSAPSAVSAPSAFSAPLAVSAPPEVEKDWSLDGVLQGLADAADRQCIAELVVGYTARQFNKSALFLIKGGLATGWLAQTGSKPRPGFDRLEISLNEPSVLKTVAESKTYYLGQLPVTPCNSRMCAALGGDPPLNQLLAPLVLMGRVVAILYVDGTSRPLDENLAELQKLLSKVSMAFEILILKSKILLT